MKGLRLASFAMTALLLLGGVAFAGMNATPEEAKAMAVKAADYLNAEGEDAAFAAFNDNLEWRDRDLYVFVVDDTGTWVSSGARPELIGMKDDSPFIQEMVAIQDEGWVTYTFTSPADRKDHEKMSYIIRVGNNWVGVGAYKY